MSTKITKLTALNIEALQMMAPGHTSLLETTKTTATFVGLTAREALGIVSRMQESAGERYGRRGGAYQSLHAVIRKLEALVSEADAETAAANDPLVALVNDTQGDPLSSLALGAQIRPKGWVTAHVEPVAEAAGAVATITEAGTAGVEAFRRYREARPGSTVPGRLRPASKCGQRRPRRGRR